MTALQSPTLTPEIEIFDHQNSSTNFLKLAMTALRLTGKQTTSSTASDVYNKLELKEYTLEEVSNHDTTLDCWIIIYDRVYDVTNFLRMHPGGDDVLLEYSGRDASLAFRGTGHSDSALKSLKLYEIGILPMHQRIFRCVNGLKAANLPE